ncbi:hypothetical protein FRZ03_07060 [Streptomyces misionensis]|uniref:Uncharacterized protein n=1 Tax=Streptomyces misionensis TaxID=67331 RepID=A0A5C6JZ78_9ACTN|nr:hypothetical protein [Streptomyces misionensis]TWV55466.1 hypothetical protein FRZ03_07060 [Streptomyces misionensis]
MSGGDQREERPETALGEVLHEAEEAERRGEKDRGKGEAGDAITPNAGAQEQSRGDRKTPGRHH